MTERTAKAIESHPTFGVIPTALGAASLAFDILALLGFAPAAGLALYALSAGAVGSFLAALPDLVDPATAADQRCRRLAWTQLGLNLGALIVFLPGLAIRFGAWTAPEGTAMLLSALTLGLMAAAGSAGGELVERHGRRHFLAPGAGRPPLTV